MEGRKPLLPLFTGALSDGPSFAVKAHRTTLDAGRSVNEKGRGPGQVCGPALIKIATIFFTNKKNSVRWPESLVELERLTTGEVFFRNPAGRSSRRFDFLKNFW